MAHLALRHEVQGKIAAAHRIIPPTPRAVLFGIEESAMARACRGIALLVLFAVLWPVAMSSQSAPARTPGAQATAVPSSDWLTWGYDQERSAFNKGETTLSKDNVSRLAMLWSTQVPVVPK